MAFLRDINIESRPERGWNEPFNVHEMFFVGGGIKCFFEYFQIIFAP